MIWKKSWWECRFRLYLGLGLMVLLWVNGLVVLLDSPFGKTPEMAWDAYSRLLTGMVLMMVVNFAGSGINSQSHWGMLHGFHSSMYFLLSLPVSRRQALLVRAAVGWLLTLLVIVLGAAPFAMLLPIRGMHVGAAPVLGTIVFLAIGSTAIFGVMTLLTTLLDELWAGILGLALAGAFVGYGGALIGPNRHFNPLTFMDGELFNRSGAVSWPAITAFIAVGALFLMASIIVVERKEY